MSAIFGSGVNHAMNQGFGLLPQLGEKIPEFAHAAHAVEEYQQEHQPNGQTRPAAPASSLPGRGNLSYIA